MRGEILLETRRLQVRRLEEADAEALYAVLSDPEVMRQIEPPFSLERTRSFLREAGLCETPLVWAVLWKQTGELIGQLIWHPWDKDSMELGWILRRDFWGRGIAKELTAAMLMQTERDVVIECSPKQTVTRHIAEAFGFVLQSEGAGAASTEAERGREGLLLYLRPKKPIRWVFFDLGSTLIDETEADLHRIREMTEGTGISVEDYQEKRLALIREGHSGDPAAIAFFGLTKTPWHSEDERPYPDAAPTLAELKHRGFRLGVIANQNPGTVQRLENWELLQYFDVVVASAEAGAAKPDPAIFRMAFKQAGCRPSEALMVGDRMDNDIAPAKDLGMVTVRILRGLGAYHIPQSDGEQPAHTIRALGELLRLPEAGTSEETP